MNAAACLQAAERGAGGWRWQDFALMRSQAAILGNFFASCIPKVALGRKKRPFLATYRCRVSKMSWRWQDMRAMYPKSAANRLSGMHSAQILPGRGPFRRTGPSNHAWGADLAIRLRRAARAIASTAPPLWRGSLPRDGRTGRGRLLVGRGGALPKECVALWGVER